MQTRCYRCGNSFTLSGEVIAAALENVAETKATHHNVHCPKCRQVTKIPLTQLKRFAPRKAAASEPPPPSENPSGA